MTGIILAILGSIFIVIGDAKKKVFSEHVPIVLVAWTTTGFAVLSGSLYLYFFDHSIKDWDRLIPLLICSITLLTAGEIFFLRGTKALEFSLSQPLKAFQPVLALPLGYLLLGEEPPPLAIFGVLTVVLGAYLLFAPVAKEGQAGRGILAPFEMILRDPAARILLVCQLIGVLAGNFQKLGSSASSGLWFCIATLLGVWLNISLYLLYRKITPFRGYKAYPRLVLQMVVFWTLGFIFWMLAFDFAYVAYIVVIGQFQPLLALPVGYLMFGEKESLKRVWPCALMIVGVLLILVVSGNLG